MPLKEPQTLRFYAPRTDSFKHRACRAPVSIRAGHGVAQRVMRGTLQSVRACSGPQHPNHPAVIRAITADSTGPESAWMASVARPSRPVASRFKITSGVRFWLARTGKPAAGNT